MMGGRKGDIGRVSGLRKGFTVVSESPFPRQGDDIVVWTWDGGDHRPKVFFTLPFDSCLYPCSFGTIVIDRWVGW